MRELKFAFLFGPVDGLIILFLGIIISEGELREVKVASFNCHGRRKGNPIDSLKNFVLKPSQPQIARLESQCSPY